MALIMKGKPVADAIYEELQPMTSLNLTLGIIKYKGSDAGGYLSGLSKAAQRLNVQLRVNEIEQFQELTQSVVAMGNDPQVHGILLLKPFPKEWNFRQASDLIPPEKDVDALHPVNLGKLAQGRGKLVPATPQAVLSILDFYNVLPLEGATALVIGRSEAVGLPAFLQLMQRNATVTVAHSRTKDLPSLSRQADLVVVAVGKPNFLTKNHVKEDAVVIDVGTNVLEDGKVVGDVDRENVEPLVRAITPVPGGVGSVTTACLFKNLFLCYQEQTR